MGIIIDSFTQDDQEWKDAHLGIPSGSGFHKLLSAGGKVSSQSTGYLREKVYERLTGKPLSDFMSYEMRMGKEHEPEGRLEYEIITGCEVRQVALIYYDDKKEWLVSPDGLIDDDGHLELKWARGDIQIERLENGWDGKEHYPQLQGNLLTSGRKWIDIVSYHPGLDPIIKRYYRDDDYCSKLYQEIYKFNKALNELEARLRAKV